MPGYQGTSSINTTGFYAERSASLRALEYQARLGNPPTGFEDAAGSEIWRAAQSGDKNAKREQKYREIRRSSC